jgi:hypothetical protein
MLINKHQDNYYYCYYFFILINIILLIDKVDQNKSLDLIFSLRFCFLLLVVFMFNRTKHP